MPYYDDGHYIREREEERRRSHMSLVEHDLEDLERKKKQELQRKEKRREDVAFWRATLGSLSGFAVWCSVLFTMGVSNWGLVHPTLVNEFLGALAAMLLLATGVAVLLFFMWLADEK